MKRVEAQDVWRETIDSLRALWVDGVEWTDEALLAVMSRSFGVTMEVQADNFASINGKMKAGSPYAKWQALSTSAAAAELRNRGYTHFQIHPELGGGYPLQQAEE
jgi:hypothetical protein